MKKRKVFSFVAVMSVLAVAALLACTGNDGVMSKSKGIYTVDTTTLGTDVRGFNGPTPLVISIKDNKIIKVEALENSETPSYFAHMTQGGMLSKWEGMTVDEAMAALGNDLDVVSGATFSSKAVAENMIRGLKYYQEHKK